MADKSLEPAVRNVDVRVVRRHRNAGWFVAVLDREHGQELEEVRRIRLQTGDGRRRIAREVDIQRDRTAALNAANATLTLRSDAALHDGVQPLAIGRHRELLQRSVRIAERALEQRRDHQALYRRDASLYSVG